MNAESVVIPADAWVIVGDSRKAVLLRNKGDEKFPNLEVKNHLEAPDNPATRDQGSDRPGRSVFRGRRSAVEQTDWHRAAETAFAGRVAHAIHVIIVNEPASRLIIVAPPIFLGDLRKALRDEPASRIIAEIPKDLTHLPVYELERHLAGSGSSRK